MIKKILITLFVLFLLTALAIYFAGAQVLNTAVSSSVEKYGPEFTKTKVQLESVDISPFSGKGSIEGLVIGNPEGFKAEKAISLGKAELDVNLKSLINGKQVIIDRIFINKPHFTYEQTLSGNNISALLKNIEESTKSQDTKPEVKPEETETETKEPTAPSEPQKFSITEFTVEGGTVSLAALGQEMTLELPTLKLKDLGGKDGATGEEIAKEVMKAVLAQVDKVTAKQLGSQVEDLIKGAGKNLQDNIKKESKGIENKIKGLFGK